MLEHGRAGSKQVYLGESITRSPSGVETELLLQLPAGWIDDYHRGEITLRIGLRMRGNPHPVAPEALGTRQAVRLTPEDDAILMVLEDIAVERLTSTVAMKAPDFMNILALCANRTVFVGDGSKIVVQGQTLPMIVRMDLDHENGELLLFANTELPFMKPGEFATYVASERDCWAFGAGHLWRVSPVLPLAYHALYKDPVVIPRSGVMAFVSNELEQLSRKLPFASDITPDLFEVRPGIPDFVLTLRGSPASLAGELMACYGEQRVPAGSPEIPGVVNQPDPDDLMCYFSRNMAIEEQALGRLKEAGFGGSRGDSLGHIMGTRAVLGFLGSELASLRRRGWQVLVEGRAAEYLETLDTAIPVVSIEEVGDKNGSFEVGITFESSAGGKLPPADVQRAILKDDGYFESEGRIVLVDSRAIASMRQVLNDCEGRASDKPGRFRMDAVYAPFVQASLQAMDGIDVDEPPEWRRRAARLNRNESIGAVSLGELDTILRPYQKEGVYWLRFLEQGGFAGILADEMGLGKTLQTLAWISLDRLNSPERKEPALIVGPTSLVANWAHEAERFTPGLRCLVMAGAKRHSEWEAIRDYDLVITSYALLRLDLEQYRHINFSVVVLDEGQYIKNRDTLNAKAVKRLRAANKLVLTGTPIENSVADLWSIMDFLMPSYLGDYDTFKTSYELPIAAGDSEGEEAQNRLRRKLKPFLLRRLKRHVAKDLPAKIQKVSFSTLTVDQERVYDTLRENYRLKINEMVASKGFNSARMEVLALLLRLRQACCHLELLPPEMLGGRAANNPSGKLDQFFELLEEAIEGGHRILVFSQFVSMLKILRRELAERGVEYCYLDGGTKDRLAECQRFNLNRNIPLFLISLKAGGTGLNLTGADMVIHFDPWWNPAVEDQATDRAHRIGQKRTVYSVKLITEGTIEEKVLELQRRKQAVINATIVSTDSAIMKSLSWSDVKELLS